MCGRFALKNPQALKAAFSLDDIPNLLPRYNIAPAQDIAIIRAEADRRHLSMAHWGLIPAWAKDAKSGYSTINARAETVDTQPSFRAPFRHHRCIIPADGFYEWHEVRRPQYPWTLTPHFCRYFLHFGLSQDRNN